MSSAIKSPIFPVKIWVEVSSKRNRSVQVVTDAGDVRHITDVLSVIENLQKKFGLMISTRRGGYLLLSMDQNFLGKVESWHYSDDPEGPTERIFEDWRGYSLETPDDLMFLEIAKEWKSVATIVTDRNSKKPKDITDQFENLAEIVGYYERLKRQF